MAFKGKVALVTGAASGMGKLSVLRLVRMGARVAAVDINESGLIELAKEHRNISSYPCDISDQAEVAKLVDNIERDLGSIDRLTHAAAIMPLSMLSDQPVDKIVQINRINFEGTVFLTQAVVPRMIKRNKGDVILFGSVAGDAPLPFAGAYCASKAAVNAYAKQLILENSNSNLRIMLVCPPPVNTPLLDQKNTGISMDFNKKERSWLVVEPHYVLEKIEQAIESNETILYPGLLAKTFLWYARLAPKHYMKTTLDNSKTDEPHSQKRFSKSF